MNALLSPQIDFLRAHLADQIRHSGRTFLEHLQGTHDLLKAWGCDEAVCTGGLFHSIYGTNAFTTQCIPLERRDEIRELIGEPAERLAYLFCTCDRPRAFIEALEGKPVGNRHDGSRSVFDPELLRQLIEIECANLIEQGSGKEFFPRLRVHLDRGRLALRPEILAAIEAYSPPPSAAVPAADRKHEIRAGATEDLDQLLWLARELHVDSRYANLYYMRDKVKRELEQHLKEERKCCLVAAREGEILAFLLGAVQELPFTSAHVATVQILYAARQARGNMARALLKAFMTWAAGKGAREIRLEDTFGVDPWGADLLFESLGLARIGGVYARWS